MRSLRRRSAGSRSSPGPCASPSSADNEGVSAPYREAPQVLVCPRCGEMLDKVFSGVAACPGCQGAWIAQATLDTAFGNPRWPPGQNMWWHATLECPECACDGSVVKMDA